MKFQLTLNKVITYDTDDPENAKRLEAIVENLKEESDDPDEFNARDPQVLRNAVECDLEDDAEEVVNSNGGYDHSDITIEPVIGG